MDRERRCKELEDELQFESMMARLSARFVNLQSSQVDSVIHEGQRLVCEGLGLDRSALFQMPIDGREKLLLTHLYEGLVSRPQPETTEAELHPDHKRAELDSIPRLPRHYQHLDALAHFPWIIERVMKYETVSISGLRDLPKDAARDRENLRRFGTKSTVIVPLHLGGERIGLITFASLREERKWSEQLIQRFRFVADLFTNVLFRQRADWALQQSEQRYRKLFDSGSDAIFLVDAETGRILDANQEAERMYGYSLTELLQNYLQDLSAEPEKTQRALAAGERHIPVRWHRRKNGDTFPVEITFSSFADRDRRILMGTIRDITERKRIEQEMQVSAARYRSLIETQADVIARSDLEGRLTYVNDAYCRMFGMSREKLVGMVFFPTVVPEDLAISQSVLKRIQEPPYRVTSETRHPTPDGIRWISWENTAVVDDSGNVLEFQGTGRDMTERKQAQEALRKSEERYREFIKLSAEGISRFEVDEPIDTSLPESEQIELICRFAYLAECNQAFARMYGIENVEDIIGMRLGQVLMGANPGSLELVKSFVSSGYRIINTESAIVDRKGKPRHFSRNLDGVVENGCLLRAWLIQHETTKQKQAEEGLRQSERALRQGEEDMRRLAGKLIFAQEEERRRLARELHDDLSQRLAMISMDTEIVQQQLADSSESLRDKIQDVQARLSEIASDIHGISRRLHPSIIETLGIAKAIESECRNYSQRENIQVQCDARPIPVQVRSEIPLCLFRIVQEGLRNIAKHARAEKVQVSLRFEDNEICLCIRDDGIGFSPDPIRKRTGLGLASMNERVRLIQGCVKIASSPGKGTLIEVRVPLARNAVAAQTAERLP